jgi:hypothetical protein
MKWKKIGRIFNPEVLEAKGLTHALMPIVEVLDEGSELLRVYFCPRSQDAKSKFYYFDFSLSEPFKTLNISEAPLLTEGILGAFDDCGITSGSFSEIDGKKAFFYTGWSLTKTVPMNNSIGVAFFNKSSGKFERIAHGPLMTRTLHEPFSCASPFVLKDGNKYKMWYASMDHWKEVNNEPLHYYNLKYAESADGINWVRKNTIAVNYEHEREYAFGRPCVLKENGLYKMWYAFRGDHYLIGYAESDDGLHWRRLDHLAGIELSSDGWDSEMIEFPYILSFKNKKYMFYNGNGFGRTGIGLAILEDE